LVEVEVSFEFETGGQVGQGGFGGEGVRFYAGQVEVLQVVILRRLDNEQLHEGSKK